jgi:hypothetical protein
MNDAGSALTRFDFTNGEQRGSHLTLHPNCLVHRGDSYLETLPLATITSVRVAYERNGSLLGWGLTLLLAAILMLVVSAPLASLAAAAGTDLATAGNPGVGKALYSVFRVFEALAALPIGALVAVLAAARGPLWLVRQHHPHADLRRRRARPGAQPQRLLDFSEAVSERLMQVKR